MRRAWRCAFLLVCFAMMAGPAAAQFDRSQLSGRVKDPEGAVVPGATVVAQNQTTQLNFTAVTDQTGFYTIPNLPPG
jgi:hypothetical protein